MKIVFGCLNHEANSFASDPGTWERWFRTNFVAVGDELLQYRDKKGAHLAGMFAAAEEEGVELIPAIFGAGAAPVLTRGVSRRDGDPSTFRRLPCRRPG